MNVMIYLQETVSSFIECVMIIPRQLGYLFILYMFWNFLPKRVNVRIRSSYIRLVAAFAILAYRMLEYPIMRMREEIQRVFGARGIEVIEAVTGFYSGYSSITEMVNSYAYKYMHLGDKLDSLGDYKLVRVNGRSKYVAKTKPLTDKYAGYILVYTTNNGIKYDVTPYGDIPTDLPDGDYELMKRVGAEYRLTGVYSNPNEIVIKTRQF